MERHYKKFKATDYGQCIIKEELIISEDEETDDADVETVYMSIDDSFLEASVEPNGSIGTSKSHMKRKRSGSLENKNDNARNDKQFTLDLLLKAKNYESIKQLENPENNVNDEKSKVAVKTASSDDLDTLYKKIAKSHCPKCNVKRAVIRRKARCPKCETRLTYSCDSCNKTYGTLTNLGHHLKNQHTPQNSDNRQVHACPTCYKTFAYRKGMMNHRKAQHGFANETKRDKVCGEEVRPHKCDKCSYTANNKWTLTRHVLERHMDFKKKCDHCGKFFTNPRSMRRHLRVYCGKEKRFECHHCGHKFYRRDQVLKHLDEVHFKGGTLTDKPTDDSHLKIHEKNHRPSKPLSKMYECSKCGRIYENPSSFRKHIDSCLKEPKFSCDKCSYKTHFKYRLIDHIWAKRATCI